MSAAWSATRGVWGRRVDVQIALGDLGELADPHPVRQSLRGVDTVVHLAATIRDQPPRHLEELNGLATVRLLRRPSGPGCAASSSSAHSTRGRRSARASSAPSGWRSARSSPRRWKSRSSRPRSSTTTRNPGSRCCGASPSCRCCRCPGRVERRSSRSGRGLAECVAGALATDARPRYELAGPETLTYDQMSDLVSRIAGRPGHWCTSPPADPLRSSPSQILGEAAFATWEEAELMEVSMLSERGSADAEALGVQPKRMSEVLT